MFNIVLYQPQIPPNTGNIARLCVGADATLHIIRPIGFFLDDKTMKRAGCDYWSHLKLKIHNSLEDLVCHSHKDAIPKILPSLCKGGLGRVETSLTPLSIAGETNVNNLKGGNQKTNNNPTIYYITKFGKKSYTEANFKEGDYLVFGSEQHGLPKDILEKNPDKTLKIPMSDKIRSHNLSNSVAIVLYEAIRQTTESRP